MPYIVESLVTDSISNISMIEFVGTPYKNEKDLLSYFLLLSKLKTNKFTPKSLNTLFEDRILVMDTLYELSGVFSPDEKVEKKGCLFFSTFFHSANALIQNKSFYNAGTAFAGLHGRLKDTIDNSIADYLLSPRISQKEKYYTFLNGVEEIVSNQYKNKFSLSSILIWLYRFREFEIDISYDELLQLFMSEYNLSSEQINILFSYDKKSLEFQETFIDGATIRNILGINTEVEIVPTGTDNTTSISIKKTTHEDLQHITGVTMNKDILATLIKKHKQIILTGVPGAGKSHIIEQLSDAFTLKKVQFHQNYTYQEFILGKTIIDGNVEYENGVFLDFLINVALENPGIDYLFVIDEINRGNTSAIFGELLHALDRDKPIELSSGYELVLPDNLFIIGSMNSADRSIALVDYAIRRRFLFVELEPDYNLLDSISTLNGEQKLGKLLLKINQQIEKILKNRDFRLGHSYFIQNGVSDFTKEDIFEIINYKIIPILYEYAQGDSSLIIQILSPEIISSSSENIIATIDSYLSNE